MPLKPLPHESELAKSLDREVDFALLGQAQGNAESIDRAIRKRLESGEAVTDDDALERAIGTITINTRCWQEALGRYNDVHRSGRDLVPLTKLSDVRIRSPDLIPRVVLRRCQLALGITQPLPPANEALSSGDPRMLVLRKLQLALAIEDGLDSPVGVSVGPIRAGETLEQVVAYDRSCAVRATAEERARWER